MATFEFPRTPFARVAVLAGGDSDEREISLQSGASVTRGLNLRGHVATPIDPSTTDLTCVSWSNFDVAFLALHGAFGEDGQVQSLLDKLGVAYTGSDAATSRVAFSKSASKERFFQRGVPTPAYVLIHESNDAHHIQRQAQKVGYPLVLKPDAQGSSLGVSIVNCPEELPQALTRCFHFDSFGVMESMIKGTEWTLGLLDDLALPLIRIETDRPFFDYEAKYVDDSTRYCFDGDEPPAARLALAHAGQSACRALGTSGLARVDLMLDQFQRPWVLEVNTTPGMTDHSLIPKAAAHVGISFGELCERATECCLSDTKKQSQVPQPYFTNSLRRKWAS